MTGQPLEFERFSIFATTLLMNGVVFGPFFIMPFTIFSGFFLHYRDAPYVFRWLFHISFLKHGLVGLMISVYGMGRPKLICTD
ncbi:ATP-binding cassette sub-family G member 4, partial [Operophtera brumata]